jgi:3-methylcrotonyl-CoA carboxylase alpha subunit
MGIETVAVYSDADRDAVHVALADVAVPIGPGPASESYLRIDKIVDAAKATGADAIHPGYGFLSENANFARACVDAGIVFVGPPASVIELLGDKSAAKKLMEEAGVPVVPGYHGDDQSEKRLLDEARAIGVPLLIKAAAGGGGRGMRVVRDLSQFAALADEARREAAAAFGDGTLLLERYIERPRHIEFQIFGDTHGNAVDLFERECSIQRRHQKIIEESPSPAMTDALRARMADAALKAARAAGYVGAGTVEFLLENNDADNSPPPLPSEERASGPEGICPVRGAPGEGEEVKATSFYFLEVNTRLQVEHPVTELVTGLDLVKLQLRIAMGESLPNTVPAAPMGHAIEARIYAEDPSTGFLPSTGELTQWIARSGPGIRLDSGVERGSVVSPYYDPMLAKLIAYGETRDEAVARLEQALTNLHALGVRTNIAYLLDIVRHPAFRTGDLSTGFLAEHFAHWKPTSEVPTDVLLALAAEAITAAPCAPTLSSPVRAGGAGEVDPWRTVSGWRNVK